ncbi:MAG: apolipoprotein N-acyltransferase [Flavobacteriaceae bacterium]
MKRNLLLAILSGLLLGFSWPTYGFAILLFIGFVPLLFVENSFRKHPVKRSGTKLFGLTYLTFLLFNSISTWWLWYASKFGMFFAIGVNSLLMTLVFFIYHKVALKTTQKKALFFLIVFWISFEKFHLNWDFSWPWLNLGNGFSLNHKWIQWYEYTGIFGGTLWIWLVNIGIFLALKKYSNNSDTKQLIRGLLINVLIVIIGIYTSLYIYHSYKINSQGYTNVVLLQPNVDPYTEKYNISNLKTAKNLIAQAEEVIDSTTNFIIAPETTFANPVLQGNYAKAQSYKLLKSFTKKHPNINFIAGYTFYKQYKSFNQPTPTANKFRNAQNSWYDMYNSAAFINAENKPQIYYKSKLVVGVELFPYKNILQPILGDALLNLGGTIASLGTQNIRTVFKTNNQNVAPIICYESIYGEYINGFVRNGANFLAVITNDGWWQNSQGHKQHLMLSKLRAIENRRSLVRAANTGVSAVINQKGDIIKHLDYGVKGLIKATVPLNNEKTFYNSYGDYIARLAQFLSILLFLTIFLRKRTNINDL